MYRSLQSRMKAMPTQRSRGWFVRACEDGIDDILKELDEYQSHLGPASKVHKSRVKDSIYKIKFILFKEEDVEEWERKMITHATSIVMLQTACVAKSHTNLCRANDCSYITSTMDQQKSLQATTLESSSAVTTSSNAAVEEQIRVSRTRTCYCQPRQLLISNKMLIILVRAVVSSLC
jgi:hypothetical protein